MKNLIKFPYVIDENNNVYKYNSNNDYFLQVSPWVKNKDRRYKKEDIIPLIECGKLVQMAAKPKIFEILNKIWDNTKWEWKYNGERYLAEREVSFTKAPLHKFYFKYKDNKNIEHEYFSSYRLVFYQGRLFLATPLHYFPKVILYKFESIDKDPKTMQRWADEKHLRPVYSYNRGEYI